MKETIKSMLAFGWTIERTKEGDPFGTHTCARRVSQSGQVRITLFSAKLLHDQISNVILNEQSHVCCVS